MRDFILYSRRGRTDPDFRNLREAGRLDVVHECAVASLFLSHGFRKNVVFNAVLYGPSNPPLHLQINGENLHDVRTDQETWKTILQRVLSGKAHPGITVRRIGFEALVKEKARNRPIYVLEEGGANIEQVTVGEHPVFILGDHIGLPRIAEVFAIRYGEKISLGKAPYLAASCITILNFMMDIRENR